MASIETAIKKMREAGFQVAVEEVGMPRTPSYNIYLKISPRGKLTPTQRHFIEQNRQELIFALKRERCIKKRDKEKARGYPEDRRRFCHECQHFNLNSERCSVTRIKQIIDNFPMHCKNFLASDPSNQP